MNKFKVLGLCGSLRRASTNMGLLRYARDNAPGGLEIAIADLADLPFFNQDLEAQAEKPQGVTNFLRQLEQADALLLACPEYNYSLAPALKNALDWASRAKDNQLLAGKPVAILGSGGGQGTARAQHHLRQVCVYLDLHPLNKPEVLVNAFSGSFNPDGDLISEKVQPQVLELVENLGTWTRRLKA